MKIIDTALTILLCIASVFCTIYSFNVPTISESKVLALLSMILSFCAGMLLMILIIGGDKDE